MVVTIVREPCWLLEAAELVYGVVNHIPVETLAGQGTYCIPKEEAARIQAEACRGIKQEDGELQFYFQSMSIESVSERAPCLGCILLYNSIEVLSPEPREMVQALSRTWREFRRENCRIDGIGAFSLTVSHSTDHSFMPLSQELANLPVSQTYRMQLLEVFSAFDEHLNRVANLLAPVVASLRPLLEPWVQRAVPLMDQWQAFFRTNSPQEFFIRRGMVRCKSCRSLYMAMRYFLPMLAPGERRVSDESLRLHMGVGIAPSLETPQNSQKLEEWELSALRLLSNRARAEMVRTMSARPMSSRELAKQLGLNPGTVFRDLNNLFNSRILERELVNDQYYYHTSFEAIRRLSSRMQEYFLDTRPYEADEL